MILKKSLLIWAIVFVTMGVFAIITGCVIQAKITTIMADPIFAHVVEQQIAVLLALREITTVFSFLFFGPAIILFVAAMFCKTETIPTACLKFI